MRFAYINLWNPCPFGSPVFTRNVQDHKNVNVDKNRDIFTCEDVSIFININIWFGMLHIPMNKNGKRNKKTTSTLNAHKIKTKQAKKMHPSLSTWFLKVLE